MPSLSKILLPVDFSSRSYGAARYAEALARQFQAEVIVVHALSQPYFELGSAELGGAAFRDLYASRAAQSRRMLEEFAQQSFPDVRASTLVLEGEPAGAIVKYAHDEHASLIVMPTHGMGPFRRFILGSVTAKVLHDADCPVWTGVHMEDAPPPDSIRFQSILAAVDLGPQSCHVVRWAAQLAASCHARLTVVHATPSIEGRAGEYFDPEWRTYFVNQARAHVEQLLDSVGSEAHIDIGHGDPAGIVSDMASRHAADVVVVGRGSTSGILGRMRTHAYAIIRQSPCPVVSV